MTTRTLATTLALLTVTGAAAFLAGRALATGAPTQTPLTYGGVVTDKDGKPYPSAQDVSLAFYDKADATVPKCVATLTQAEAGTGRFSVVLPGECAQAVHDAPDLWTEATVGAGKTVLPRTHVGAVPYALEADSAKQAITAVGAGGALKSQLDGLASDVAGLKGAPQPKPPIVTVLKGDMGANLSLNSSGGLLQFVGRSLLYCDNGDVGPVAVYVDGVAVGKIPVPAVDGQGHLAWTGSLFAQVASGPHLIKFVPGWPGTKVCVCWEAGSYVPCEAQVVEFKP